MAGGMKKNSKQKIPMEEGTHDVEAVSSNLVNRDIPYVQSHCMGVSPPKVSNRKFIVLVPHISQGVSLEGSPVGRVNELKFSDHGFQDRKKFPNFMPRYYMNSIMVESGKPPLLTYQKWAQGLELFGITNLLNIPHFGWSMFITNCVKKFLSCVNRGLSVARPPVSIDAALIHRITRLPMVGEDPLPFVVDKHTDKEDATHVAAQYQLSRGHRGLVVAGIEDKATNFGT